MRQNPNCLEDFVFPKIVLDRIVLEGRNVEFLLSKGPYINYIIT